jgi:hypothetical protein
MEWIGEVCVSPLRRHLSNLLQAYHMTQSQRNYTPLYVASHACSFMNFLRNFFLKGGCIGDGNCTAVQGHYWNPSKEEKIHSVTQICLLTKM